MKHNERYLYYVYKKHKKQSYAEQIGNLEKVSPYLYYLYKRVLSPEQKEVLKIIRNGEDMTPDEISKKMGIGNVSCINRLCRSLGEKDLVDVMISGKVIITPKGERALAIYPMYQLP